MEYFRIIKVKTTEDHLQERLQLDYLEEMSNLIFPLEEPKGELVQIGGLWGDFTLSRDEIKGGLRFALIECPNALCWTLTTGYPPDREAIVMHLTINRTRKKKEFLEDIEAFMEDAEACIAKLFSS